MIRKVAIDEILKNDPTQPRQQRHTAKRIYDRLVEEHKFAGGEATVREYVRKRKRELGLDKREVFIPIVHAADGTAQVDWGTAVVRIAGQGVHVQFFAARPITAASRL